MISDAVFKLFGTFLNDDAIGKSNKSNDSQVSTILIITCFKSFIKTGLLHNPVNLDRFWLTGKLLNSVTELANICF